MEGKRPGKATKVLPHRSRQPSRSIFRKPRKDKNKIDEKVTATFSSKTTYSCSTHSKTKWLPRCKIPEVQDVRDQGYKTTAKRKKQMSTMTPSSPTRTVMPTPSASPPKKKRRQGAARKQKPLVDSSKSTIVDSSDSPDSSQVRP